MPEISAETNRESGSISAEIVTEAIFIVSVIWEFVSIDTFLSRVVNYVVRTIFIFMLYYAMVTV
jgi:hypothetical protein